MRAIVMAAFVAALAAAACEPKPGQPPKPKAVAAALAGKAIAEPGNDSPQPLKELQR
jgi:hypothetical protein